MGILCRTQREAARLHRVLEAGGAAPQLLTARSAAFRRGVVVCTVHLAKGLEFDAVVVPHATAESYATPLDRNLLYVACTRAMHRLLVTHAGARTRFIADLSACETEAPGGEASAAA